MNNQGETIWRVPSKLSHFYIDFLQAVSNNLYIPRMNIQTRTDKIYYEISRPWIHIQIRSWKWIVIFRNMKNRMKWDWNLLKKCFRTKLCLNFRILQSGLICSSIKSVSCFESRSRKLSPRPFGCVEVEPMYRVGSYSHYH